jgi:hypothetical protein
MNERLRTTSRAPENNYYNADFLEKHQSGVDVSIIMQSASDRTSNGTIESRAEGQDTTHGEQIFETNGDNDRESFIDQCQNKVQAKREAAKLRRAKRSSIIVSNLVATELRYSYVPPASDRRSLTPERLYTKWEVSEITNSAPFDDADGHKQPFWTPGQSNEDVLQQMSRFRFLEIPLSTLKLGSQIARHDTSIMYKAEWNSPLGEFEVAVKSLSDKADSKDTLCLLREAAALGQFKHVNVVRFYGVVTLHEPVMCVTELLTGGDLKTHLMSYRSHLNTAAELSMLPTELLKFCREIAMGMRYLATKGFMHKQLQARNVLLSRNLICKICQIDSPMKSDDRTAHNPSPGQPSIRWLAPEVVLLQRPTFRSDVWSFGMVMFEIWSLGATPFDDIPNQKVLTLLNTGYCQPPPPGCPKSIYSIMTQCWNPEGKERPTFSEVVQMLQAVEASVLITQDKGKMKSTSLGQPLKAGYNLYKDLQEMYM